MFVGFVVVVWFEFVKEILLLCGVGFGVMGDIDF